MLSDKADRSGYKEFQLEVISGVKSVQFARYCIHQKIELTLNKISLQMHFKLF